MDVKWPEKDRKFFGTNECLYYKQGWNDAIDACIKAYNEAKPAGLEDREKERLFQEAFNREKAKHFKELTPPLVPLDEEEVLEFVKQFKPHLKYMPLAHQESIAKCLVAYLGGKE